MDSGKILMSLTVSLAIWIGIVLVLLLAQNDFNDNAIAVPISANLEEQSHAQINIPSPDLAATLLADTSSAIQTEIAGEIKKGESFDLAMKRLKVSNTVRH